MWSPSKALLVNPNQQEEKHTYTVPGAAERGATREVQAGGSSGSQGASKGQQLKALLSWWEGEQNRIRPQLTAQGHQDCTFLCPTSEWQCPSQPRTFLSPTSTPKHWPKVLPILKTWLHFAKCISPGLSKPSWRGQGVDKKLVWGLRGYIYEL